MTKQENFKKELMNLLVEGAFCNSENNVPYSAVTGEVYKGENFMALAPGAYYTVEHCKKNDLKYNEEKVVVINGQPQNMWVSVDEETKKELLNHCELNNINNGTFAFEGKNYIRNIDGTFVSYWFGSRKIEVINVKYIRSSMVRLDPKPLNKKTLPEFKNSLEELYLTLKRVSKNYGVEIILDTTNLFYSRNEKILCLSGNPEESFDLFSQVAFFELWMRLMGDESFGLEDYTESPLRLTADGYTAFRLKEKGVRTESSIRGWKLDKKLSVIGRKKEKVSKLVDKYFGNNERLMSF